MSEVTETVKTVSTMPLANLITLLAGILVILIVVAYLIKKFGLQISKGSIKAQDYEYDQNCQTLMYHMQETIDQIDYETRRNMRKETILCNYHISALETVNDMCPAARRSLLYAFKDPFFEVINNNHFTRELMPGNFEYYRTTIYNSLKNSYQYLLFEYGNDLCDKDNLPEWNRVETAFYDIVDEWLVMAQNEVIKSCKRKISVYEKELKNVENSKHWKEVLDGCIQKNQNYIKIISNRLENK